ncbi:MAG: GNAT family N-acetyltransferase [Anaerolineae bacterium]
MVSDTYFRLLHPQDYPAVLPLFEAAAYHLAPLAVLTGAADGQVFTSNSAGATVKSVLLVANHRYYLAGVVDDKAFNQALYEWLKRQLFALRSVGEWGVVLYLTHPDWQQAVGQIILAQGAFSASRLVYERALSPKHPLVRPIPAAGYSLRLVDADLMSETGLSGRDDLLAELVSERSSVDDFLTRSYGYALLYHSGIVGWCLSEYNLGDRCEVGIATAEGHQQRGLATASGLALLELARERGVRRIGWDCWARNLASSAAAERLGFHLVHAYTCYCCPAHPGA